MRRFYAPSRKKRMRKRPRRVRQEVMVNNIQSGPEAPREGPRLTWPVFSVRPGCSVH